MLEEWILFCYFSCWLGSLSSSATLELLCLCSALWSPFTHQYDKMLLFVLLCFLWTLLHTMVFYWSYRFCCCLPSFVIFAELDVLIIDAFCKLSFKVLSLSLFLLMCFHVWLVSFESHAPPCVILFRCCNLFII